MPDVFLFKPLTIRSVTLRNRVWMSPMCQYSSNEGHPTDWHLVHLGSRAIGGAGLVMVEATAVSPEGRISPGDSGLWSDGHVEGFQRINRFIREHGAVTAVQLAHAGRKASMGAPWSGKHQLSPNQGGWTTLGPSPIPFSHHDAAPQEMTEYDIRKVVKDYESASQRAVAAGFQVIELHMAHGYLLHEFLSPISNHRQDQYGGSLENRMRFPLEVATAVRKVLPETVPLFVRISATDWAEGASELTWLDKVRQGSWDLAQSLVFCKKLKDVGVDLIDCSTGGTLAKAEIPVEPNYQVPFCKSIREKVGILTGAVGLITEPQQAEDILRNNEADAVLLGRALLRDPYWPLHAAAALKSESATALKPKQYLRS